MIRVAILIALTFWLPAFSTAETKDQTIHIGFSSILTGPWAAWGTSVRDGFLLASEQSDKKYQIDFQDDQADPKQVLSNARKFMMARKNVIVIAPMEGLDAAAPTVAKDNLAVFALGNITDDILNRQKNVFALNAYADADPRYIAAYLAKRGTTTLSIINGVNSVGEAMGARMDLEARQRNIRILSRDSVPIDIADFRTLAAKVRAANPGAVFIHQGDEGLLNCIRQLRSIGYSGEIYTIFTFESDPTRKAYGPYLDGVKYTFPVGTASDDVEWHSFSQAFEKRFGQIPNANAAMAYDSFRIIEQVLGSCPTAQVNCVTNYFRSHSNFSGAAGRIVINENRGPQRPMGIKQMQGGKFEWLTQDVGL